MHPIYSGKSVIPSIFSFLFKAFLCSFCAASIFLSFCCFSLKSNLVFGVLDIFLISILLSIKDCISGIRSIRSFHRFLESCFKSTSLTNVQSEKVKHEKELTFLPFPFTSSCLLIGSTFIILLKYLPSAIVEILNSGE